MQIPNDVSGNIYLCVFYRKATRFKRPETGRQAHTQAGLNVRCVRLCKVILQFGLNPIPWRVVCTKVSRITILSPTKRRAVVNGHITSDDIDYRESLTWLFFYLKFLFHVLLCGGWKKIKKNKTNNLFPFKLSTQVISQEAFQKQIWKHLKCSFACFLLPPSFLLTITVILF